MPVMILQVDLAYGSMLCRCGNVASAIIEKDIVGNPKGVAVIEFESESARKVALTLSGTRSMQSAHQFDDHWLKPVHIQRNSLRNNQ